MKKKIIGGRDVRPNAVPEKSFSLSASGTWMTLSSATTTTLCTPSSRACAARSSASRS